MSRRFVFPPLAVPFATLYMFFLGAPPHSPAQGHEPYPHAIIQAANRRLFLAPPHLPVDVVIFPTVASFQPQYAVGPQFAAGLLT